MTRNILLLLTFLSFIYFFESCSTADVATVTLGSFNVIKLEMSFDKVFPDYTGGGQSYIGWDVSRKAFKGGTTEIVLTKSRANIPRQNFTSFNTLFVWTLKMAGDSTLPFPYGSNNPNVSIISAIEDVDTTLSKPSEVGFTILRDSSAGIPYTAYLLSARIRGLGLSSVDFAALTTGVATHELGHARGIYGDDNTPNTPINPPHSGNDASNCAMKAPACLPLSNNPPSGCPDYYNPYFCEGHRIFLSQVYW